MRRGLRCLVSVCASLSLAGCSDDPQETRLDSGDSGAEVGDATDADSAGDGGALDDAAFAWADLACEPIETAYRAGADDGWPVCISDGGEYVPIQQSVSSIARVGAFESIAELLWRDGVPSTEDFISARDVYATGEGLDSRVQRREDEHYPPVSDGAGGTLSCRDEGVPAMDPERCVGPALILPILNDAFQRGLAQEAPTVQAARIEAALLWFLYVSTYKEGTTCANVRVDCDSSWAYYTGGRQRDDGIGLAGYVRASVSEAHDLAFDGVLGLRCWRDVEQDDPAGDTALQTLALVQLDTALLNGLARVVADRMARLTQPGADRNADWAFVQVLGPVLDREATRRDASAAAELRAAWATASPDGMDLRALIETLAGVFPCP